VSKFLAGPSIEIWIGVFISIIAFYLVFKLSLSGSCFAIRYRFPEIRDEVPEKVRNDQILIRFERVTFAKAPTSQDGAAPLNDADLAGFEPLA